MQSQSVRGFDRAGSWAYLEINPDLGRAGPVRKERRGGINRTRRKLTRTKRKKTKAKSKRTIKMR